MRCAISTKTAARLVQEAKAGIEALTLDQVEAELAAGTALLVDVHCASGGRPALAAQTQKSMGYGNVANLDGGFKAWQDAGKPVET